MLGSVLVTGGSGYFARGFVKHLLDNNLSDRVCIYSRGEWAQAQMREWLKDDPRCRWFIGDVRDLQRLRRAMEGIEIVIHAAALKRIEVGKYNPEEMTKTNINGAINVVEAAHDASVDKVVFLSTDKAWQALSPYGQSKALAESIFLQANNTRGVSGPIFAACRYGNVWRSTGSLVPRWESMIVAGAKKVPVTDPACTRFFMTRQEAVELVMNTIERMEGGELVIPTWLPAYRVGDLAMAFGVGMEVIGLPEWEKLHEGMTDGVTSDLARRMTVEELKKAIKYD